jgi:hypothetical protein
LGGDLARGEGACAVRVDQQLQHHPGRVGQFAIATDALGLDQPVNVQRGNRVLDEPREVALRQSVAWRRRQQEALVRILGFAELGHAISLRRGMA